MAPTDETSELSPAPPPPAPPRRSWAGPDPLRDLTASLAVALVAIPLCLGIAQASGAPLLAGLLSGSIGGIVVGSLSNSGLSVSGPAAGLTTLVLAALGKLPSYPVFLSATVLAGLLQLLLSALKAGGLGRLFPSCVIRGMLAAIGLTLIFKQLPHLVGFDVEQFGVMEFEDVQGDVDEPYRRFHLNTFRLIAAAIAHVEPSALLIGVICLATLFWWDRSWQRRLPYVPGSLVAVALGVAVAALLPAPHALELKHLVKIPSPADGLLTFPDWSHLHSWSLYETAFAVALIASVETLLTVEALDRVDPQRRVTNPNRELFAQGIGNMVCGMLGGLPVTSVTVRGSVNLSAGAVSRRSVVMHGIWILVALFAFRPLLNHIPLAALAAVLVHVGFKMAHPRQVREQMQRGFSQGLPFVVTIIAVMLSDLLIGIMIGTLVSACFIFRNLHLAGGFTVGGAGLNRNIRLHQQVTFFHKVALNRVLDALPGGSVLEIDGTAARHIDRDILDIIDRFCERAPLRNINVLIGGIPRMQSVNDEQKLQNQKDYEQLLSNNRDWVSQMQEKDPNFFVKMAAGQAPSFLFIGCSDSRVPAEVITGTEPGRLFVHRNIANLVSPSDMNLMSVLQYSVEHLNVPHIIVCGHYGCGGLRAAISQQSFGLIDNWVYPIKQLLKDHAEELALLPDEMARERRLVELHVMQQVRNLLRTATVQKSIRKLGLPRVHGWVYDLHSGAIKDLEANCTLEGDIPEEFHFQF